jgi:hypothetical protein
MRCPRGASREGQDVTVRSDAQHFHWLVAPGSRRVRRTPPPYASRSPRRRGLRGAPQLRAAPRAGGQRCGRSGRGALRMLATEARFAPQELGVAEDRVHRRSCLVRHVGRERALRLVGDVGTLLRLLVLPAAGEYFHFHLLGACGAPRRARGACSRAASSGRSRSRPQPHDDVLEPAAGPEHKRVDRAPDARLKTRRTPVAVLSREPSCPCAPRDGRVASGIPARHLTPTGMGRPRRDSPWLQGTEVRRQLRRSGDPRLEELFPGDVRAARRPFARHPRGSTPRVRDAMLREGLTPGWGGAPWTRLHARDNDR